LERSELPGTHGNIEYLIWISSSEPRNKSKWTERIEQLAREGK
jgi:23S rRNA (cytidine1920-2'-O)/16S rRNA (cytidine1409-2'-O)-methyltransferase